MICFIIVNLSSTVMEDLCVCVCICTVVQLCFLFLKLLQYINDECAWNCTFISVLIVWDNETWYRHQLMNVCCFRLQQLSYLVIIWHVYFVYWITELRGIDCQSEVGFLALLEHLRYCEVGSFLKNPKHPVWVMGSETHLTGIGEWCIHIV